MLPCLRISATTCPIGMSDSFRQSFSAIWIQLSMIGPPSECNPPSCQGRREAFAIRRVKQYGLQAAASGNRIQSGEVIGAHGKLILLEFSVFVNENVCIDATIFR